MSENLYFLSIFLPLAAIVFVFGMRYRAQILQAQAGHENDQQYRQLAEQAAASQAAITTALVSIEASLAELKTRVAGVEKVLKEVD